MPVFIYVVSYLHNFLNPSATCCTCVPMITCTLVFPGRIIPATPADLITFSSTNVLSFISRRSLVIQLSIEVMFSFPPKPSKTILATSVKSLFANTTFVSSVVSSSSLPGVFKLNFVIAKRNIPFLFCNCQNFI